jgi:hypothetical protein
MLYKVRLFSEVLSNEVNVSKKNPQILVTTTLVLWVGGFFLKKAMLEYTLYG